MRVRESPGVCALCSAYRLQCATIEIFFVKGEPASLRLCSCCLSVALRVSQTPGEVRNLDLEGGWAPGNEGGGYEG